MPNIRLRLTESAVRHVAELTGSARNLFDQLAGEGLAEEGSLSEALQELPLSERLECKALMDLWKRAGRLVRTLTHEGAMIATQIAISPRYTSTELDAKTHYRLSRFAYCRADEGEFLVESPRSLAQVVVHQADLAALLVTLAQTPRSLTQCENVAERALMSLLGETGLLVATHALEGTTEEDQDVVLRQWEFHDQLFHHRSRPGRHRYPIGGTFRFKGMIEPEPVLKPPMSGELLVLPKPDLAQIQSTDPPFGAVLEARRSLRAPGETDLTIDVLSTFLFRSARVQRLDLNRGSSWRPYPSGGARHELEIYLISATCGGLDPGFYHYAPDQHALERMPSEEAERDAFLARANQAQGGPVDLPGVLFLVTARFQRTSWKYSGISYALILKNVGALYQTFYLTATCLGLAPCAVGTGDSDAFARLSGLSPDREGLVGEFSLR